MSSTNGNSKIRPILAAGAVVTRRDPVRGTEIVLIHRERYDDWTLPKGKIDAGETLPACAVREVVEETGVRIRLGLPLDTVNYVAGKAGAKQVRWWGGVVLSSVPRPPDAEVDEVSWMPARTALTRLSYAQDQFVVEQYLEQPPTVPLLIVRHAKAMERRDWTRKDSARPISAQGRRQARKLVPMLSAFGIERLISSTSTRCLSTLQPYASSEKVQIASYAQLSEEVGSDDPKGVARVIRKLRAEVVESRRPTAICVHRPVLPHILEALEIPPTTLATGEFVVAHLADDLSVHALERHRPL